ncbi:MAG: FAD-dependent monooxygenase [Bacillota bacterium]|nr:FAD-dependent monooxygenase [Bacillota bacterium]
MKFLINNIRLSLDEDLEELRNAAARKLKLSKSSILSLKIIKESIDARRKPNITFLYSVMVEVEGSHPVTRSEDIRVMEEIPEEAPVKGSEKLKNRPVIVGSGPAGLFAGLVLSQNGYKPLILERGQCIEKRTEIVHRYWERGVLDSQTNVQFGEGGAGTFSDGKLTTRINDTRCKRVLEEFHKAGAPEEILYKAKPHIGSDILKDVVINLRKSIEAAGGEIRFNSRVTSLKLENGQVNGVVINETDEIDSEIVILAIGHSARDTYSSLLSAGVAFTQKAFSIGVRIEHPQTLIDRAQYGQAAGHPRLGASDYQLFYKTGERTVYSFCMCPGGVVVASASEPNSVVTNGMSYFARDLENANSALVVSVGPGDFENDHPLAGVEFQRTWERLAFDIAGKNSSAPIQRLEDFIMGRKSTGLGSVKPSYTGATALSDINKCLPEFVTASMKKSIGYFDNKLKGFGMKDAILTGVETRTSSPVRIPRGETLEAVNTGGLYPAGEGAGYAGGIVSAAVDGIRIAEQIMKVYEPLI